MKYLICARAAAPLFVVRGTVFTHKCSECAAVVAISPASLKFMETAQLTLICVVCLQAWPAERVELELFRPEGADARTYAMADTSLCPMLGISQRPMLNMYRHRN